MHRKTATEWLNTQGDCCYILKVPTSSIYFCLRWSDCDWLNHPHHSIFRQNLQWSPERSSLCGFFVNLT
nr:MAG TPA: hypothetical protein [Caudoviricetes sp.]